MSHTKSYLTEQDMKLFEDKGEIVQYKPKDVILHQDTVTDKLCLIRSGVVQIDFSRVYAHDTLALLGDGDFFGEVSFLDHRESSASAIAAKHCEILEVAHDILRELLAADDGLGARFYKTIALTLANRIRFTNVH